MFIKNKTVNAIDCFAHYQWLEAIDNAGTSPCTGLVPVIYRQELIRVYKHPSMGCL